MQELEDTSAPFWVLPYLAKSSSWQGVDKKGGEGTTDV